jgi:hypothetical protein
LIRPPRSGPAELAEFAMPAGALDQDEVALINSQIYKLYKLTIHFIQIRQVFADNGLPAIGVVRHVDGRLGCRSKSKSQPLRAPLP